jgi:polysaccharide deacetylase family protein (PEP-CTERM system associated)
MKILTFDIEEWFHILDNTSTKLEGTWSKFESRIQSNIDRILGLLDDHDRKGTFFCLGWIAAKYPEIIKLIHQCGHEIGSHSHLHQLVYEQKPKVFKEDLLRSIDSLQSITGSKVSLYRSPGFSITKECSWAFEILIDSGIECDSSIFPARRNHGGIPGFPYAEPFKIEINGYQLKELPMNIYKLGHLKIPFSGGGYFRLFPYSVIKHMSNQSQYLMTYFHPRDFDIHQPVIQDLSIVRKFKSYYGLAGAYKKLDRFLHDNEFIPVNEAIMAINWSNVPVHKIEYK